MKRNDPIFRDGQEVYISIDALMCSGCDLTYVDIATNHDGHSTFYMLYNEFGELCCLDGESCTIDHIVNGTTDLYDLVNRSYGDIHFMLSKHDLIIATHGHCTQVAQQRMLNTAAFNSDT